MATFYFMVGIPASGKSTCAKVFARTGAVIVNTDQIRFEHQASSEEAFDRARRMIRMHLIYGSDVVFDATNTLRQYRAENIAAGRDLATATICLWLDTPLDLCLARHMERQMRGQRTSLSLERLQSFAAQLTDNPPTTDEGFDQIMRITPGVLREMRRFGHNRLPSLISRPK